MGWLSDRIVRWQREQGRSNLPWQGTRDPYRIWVSEIMLQQTQVAAVTRYFERFIARFPDLRALAGADLDEVMRLWSGLGYYSRARNLHMCARRLVDGHGGEFPKSGVELAKLPGIGRSSGAAIAAFAFGARAPILDGNVRRVLCRVFAVEGYPGRGPVERHLWEIAGRELPERAIETYTQGLMDLGATLCTRSRPACHRCPLRTRCLAREQGRAGELPSPRPRRAIASRATTMLVLRRGDDVLLERRPPSGIWGGLWSLPQFDGDRRARGDPGTRSALESAVARSGYRLISRRALPAFEHLFTHLRLRVEPVLAVVATPRATRVREAPGEIWLALDEVESAALPAPVKSLLLRLRDG
ncbi:MAG: A/G-specific adenine glycosylase [Burkholderiaceae bacterium]|nr:A/G-specific adenine glycosylase [Burkholderiaceae bacterium]